MPSYLNDVAGPVMYQTVKNVIELWRTKSKIAGGRPWVASEDVKMMSLDAMMGFAFGPSSEHNAITSAIGDVRKLIV
jgi:hypothetical protein